jgi:hypothetical protein
MTLQAIVITDNYRTDLRLAKASGLYFRGNPNATVLYTAIDEFNDCVTVLTAEDSTVDRRNEAGELLQDITTSEAFESLWESELSEREDEPTPLESLPAEVVLEMAELDREVSEICSASIDSELQECAATLTRAEVVRTIAELTGMPVGAISGSETLPDLWDKCPELNPPVIQSGGDPDTEEVLVAQSPVIVALVAIMVVWLAVASTFNLGIELVRWFNFRLVQTGSIDYFLQEIDFGDSTIDMPDLPSTL